MRIASVIASAPVLALVAACSQPAEDDAGAAAREGTAVALSGEAGFATAADCYAQLGAASRLVSALAEQSSGAERQDLADRAVSRELAAYQYQLLANRLAEEIGQSPEVSNQAFRQAQAAVAREFDARGFEDFAVWVGERADRCPPPDVG